MPILTQSFRTFTNIFETILEQISSAPLQMQGKLHGCVKQNTEKIPVLLICFLKKENIRMVHNSIYESFKICENEI